MISFSLGYFVKSVAYDDAAIDAYKIAYSEAFKAAADTITQAARDVEHSKTTAQESLDKITRVSNDSLATSDQITKQKQIIDGIIQTHFDTIVKGILDSPAKDEILKVSQPEIINMRDSITDVKTRLDRLSLDLSGSRTELAEARAQLAALKQNLGTWDAPPDAHSFIPASSADPNGSFNCIQGYYMIGVTFKNNNLPQILCRPLADLAREIALAQPSSSDKASIKMLWFAARQNP